MDIYIIRHGEPDYKTDSLTSNGFKQAEKLAERFKKLHIDRLLVSTHGRTRETAQPIINTHKEVVPEYADWLREDNGGKYFFTMTSKKHGTWYFYMPKFINLFKKEKILKLGNKWYKDDVLKNTKMLQGYKQMSKWVDDFFLECGFKHNRKTHKYIKVKDNNPNVVVIIAHGGFAHSFISNLLDIPYPLFTSTHRDISLTSITKIDLNNNGGYPFIVKYNDASHLE